MRIMVPVLAAMLLVAACVQGGETAPASVTPKAAPRAGVVSPKPESVSPMAEPAPAAKVEAGPVTPKAKPKVEPATEDPEFNTAPSTGDVTRAKEVGQAFKLWLDAAERKDGAAFRRQLSRESRQLIEEDLKLPGEHDAYAGLLREIGGQASGTRIVEVALTETHATVVYQEAGGKDAMPMVLEDGAWRVDLMGKMKEDLDKLQRGEIEIDPVEIGGMK